MFFRSAEFSPLAPTTFKPPVACVIPDETVRSCPWQPVLFPAAIALPALILMAVALSSSALVFSRTGRTTNPAWPVGPMSSPSNSIDGRGIGEPVLFTHHLESARGSISNRQIGSPGLTGIGPVASVPGLHLQRAPPVRTVPLSLRRRRARYPLLPFFNRLFFKCRLDVEGVGSVVLIENRSHQ